MCQRPSEHRSEDGIDFRKVAADAAVPRAIVQARPEEGGVGMRTWLVRNLWRYGFLEATPDGRLTIWQNFRPFPWKGSYRERKPEARHDP